MHLTNCPPPLVERTKQEQSALHRRKEREVEQAVRLEDMEAAAAAVANGNRTVPATTAAAAGGAAAIGRAAVSSSSIDGGTLAEPAAIQAQVHQPSLHPSLSSDDASATPAAAGPVARTGTAAAAPGCSPANTGSNLMSAFLR